MELIGRDPTYVAAASRAPGGFDAWLEAVMPRIINDPRDVPFVKLMVLLTATVVPTGVVLFLPGMFRWWLAAIHSGLFVFFLGPYILMLHNTSHRRLFRQPFRAMNYYIPWVLGPFFGESPETYFAHHVGMHHPENNMLEDDSTTLPYVRDSFLHFTRYFLRFMFGAIFRLPRYFLRKRRKSLMVRMLVGELTFYAVVVALAVWVSLPATLVVFIAPYIMARFGMMAGNWGQHAFVDEAAPANCYRNSITCINSTYNRRCFNDGYHIGHHLSQTRHWTDMPVEFLENQAVYAQEEAIVFTDIDFFVVWFFLMVKRYDWLVDKFVDLAERKRSRAEIEALLRRRTSWRMAAST